MSLSNSNIEETAELIKLSSETIADLEAQIENLKTLPYYNFLNNSHERLAYKPGENTEALLKLDAAKNEAFKIRIALLNTMRHCIKHEKFYTLQEMNKPSNLFV